MDSKTKELIEEAKKEQIELSEKKFKEGVQNHLNEIRCYERRIVDHLASIERMKYEPPKF